MATHLFPCGFNIVPGQNASTDRHGSRGRYPSIPIARLSCSSRPSVTTRRHMATPKDDDDDNDDDDGGGGGGGDDDDSNNNSDQNSG